MALSGSPEISSHATGCLALWPLKNTISSVRSSGFLIDFSYTAFSASRTDRACTPSHATSNALSPDVPRV